MGRPGGRRRSGRPGCLFPYLASPLSPHPFIFFSLGKFPIKVGRPRALALNLASWKEDGLHVAFMAVKLTRGLPCGQWGDSRTGYLPLDPPVPFLGSRAPPIPSLSASLCYPQSSRLHRAALVPKSQWCHLLCFPGIPFVGNHFGALVQALGQTGGAPPGTHWRLLDALSVASRGQEAPMEPALSGEAGRGPGEHPLRGESASGVLLRITSPLGSPGRPPPP